MYEPTFRENVKFVIVRRFGYLPEARICEASMRNAGIRSFLSNTNTSQLLPFMDGEITLHVAEHQLEQAMEILNELDLEASRFPDDEDYREADLDDIEFARQMHEREERMKAGIDRFSVMLLFAVILIVVLVYAILMGYRYF